MIKTIFELGINLLEIFLCVDFVTRYLGFRLSKIYSVVGFISAWFIGFVTLTYINQVTFFETFGAYIPGVIYFIYALLFLKGSIMLKLWIAVIAQTLVTMIAITTNLFVCVAIGYDPYLMITSFNFIRIISVISTKILYFITSRLLLKFRYTSPIDRRTLVILIFIPLCSTISLSYLMLPAFEYTKIRVYLLIGMLAIILANAFAYFFFVKVNKDYKKNLHTEMQKQQYEQQISAQSKHLDEMLIMQKQVRSFRHDLGNHFIAISGYFESSDYQGGVNYINSIKSSLSNNADNIDTGNIAFDAIISTKKTVAESKGIKFTTNLQIPEKLKVDAIDLCIIFGNALDNAIEACERETSSDKHISLSAIYDENQLICKVVNTSHSSEISLETKKSDKENHGFGIDNIKTSLGRYNNVLKIEQTENEFILSFIIFNC